MIGIIIRQISPVTHVVNVENKERFVQAVHLVEATFPVTEEPAILHPVPLPRTRQTLSSENVRPVGSATPTGPASRGPAPLTPVEDKMQKPATRLNPQSSAKQA